MSLNELLQQGWEKHHSETDAVADRLEAGVDFVENPGGAANYMNLVNHCIGGHLKDRDRAMRLCEAAFERLEGDVEGAPLLYLAVARRLGGNDAGADELHVRLGGDQAALVRMNMLVSEGHMNAGDWDQADALYRETLAVAESLDEGHSAERSVATVSNNIASELIEMDRSTKQTSLMESAADASRTFWMRIGTWINDARADYLLSLVCTAAGKPADGRMYADRGLQTITDNLDEKTDGKVDEAFLHLAGARAARDLNDTEAHQASLASADALAADFAKGLVGWFQDERKKAE